MSDLTGKVFELLPELSQNLSSRGILFLALSLLSVVTHSSAFCPQGFIMCRRRLGTTLQRYGVRKSEVETMVT